MKKILLQSSVAAILGIGCVVGYNYFQPAKHSGYALEVPGFDSLEKLATKADTIVKAYVPAEFEEVEVELPYDGEHLYQVAKVYKIEIQEPLKDAEGIEYKKGDVVDFVIPLGVKQKKDDHEGGLLPYSDKEIQFQSGEYMLFLDRHDSKEYGKQILMLQNRHHIYKKSNDGLFANDEYENIASDNVPTIAESDLVATIKQVSSEN